MPSKKVTLVTGEKYHVYNRGVDKRAIFTNKEEYLRFYQSLAFFNTEEPTGNYRLARSKFNVANQLVFIHAYALLPNHFHLILEQVSEGGISEFMRRVATGYTSYFNEKHNRSGALFQGRFKRVHVESDEQYNYLFAYVNENHIVHNVTGVREIMNSSSLHYQRKNNSKLIQGDSSLEYDVFSAQKLALAIYKSRNSYKDTLE